MEKGAEVSLVNKLRNGCVQVPKRWSGDCGKFSTVDEVKTDKLMREAADRIELLASELKDEQKRIEMLTFALERIANADWPGPIPLVASRADWMQQIAKEALQ